MANIQSIITNVNGNVLIGTTTDSGYKLLVNGTTYIASTFVVAGNGNGTAKIGNSGFGGNYTGISLNGNLNTGSYNFLSSTNDNHLYINRPSGNDIYFRVNNNDQVSILSSGNVGIATTTPSSKLQVAGTTSFYNGASSDGAINPGSQEVISTGFNLAPSQTLALSTITLANSSSWKAILIGEYANNLEGGGLTSNSLEIELDSSSPSISVGSVSITFSRNSSTGLFQVTNNNGSYRATFVGTIKLLDYPQSGLPAISKIMLKNALIGTTADSGARLSIEGGAAMTSGWTRSLYVSANYPSIVMRSSAGGNSFVAHQWDSGSNYIFNMGSNSDTPLNGVVYAVNASTRNMMIGTTTDAGYKLNVNGTFLSQGTAYFSGNVNFSNQYRTYGLPYFEMGGGGITDEYLLLVPNYVSGFYDPYLLMGELQFQRGSTTTGNDISITTINIQTAYNNTAFYQFSIEGATVWTSIDLLSVNGVQWLALKARTNGGGPYLVNQFVGNLTDSGSQMLTRIRLSDAGVSLITANVYLPSYTNYSTQVVNGSLQAKRFSNVGFLGTGQINARNHFTPLGAGSASPATGWIAAAFGDALADRVVIGQWTNGAQQAIIGAHTANLDDWADTNYISKNHKFYYNGDWSIAPALTVNTSGNVLIGTTTDSGYKLAVTGNTVLGYGQSRPVFYDSGGGNFQIKASAGGWATGYFFQGSSGTFRGGWGGFGSGNDLSYLWAGDAYDTPTMVVYGAQGNVGIGTTEPSNKLTVTRSAATQGQEVTYGLRVVQGKPITIGGDNDYAYIQSWSSGPLAINSQGNNILFPNANSNVIIGTTTDNGYKLRVNGKGYFDSNVAIFPTSESWAEGLSFVMPTAGTWGGLRWRRERVGNDGNWYIGFTALDATDDLVFGANDGGSQNNNILRLTKAGNVAIGTPTPLLTNPGRGNLTVNGSSDAVFTLGISNTWAGYFYANAVGVYLAGNGARVLDLETNGATRLRATSSGNILIGTTTDSGEKLRVIGGNTEFRYDQNGTSYTYLRNWGAGGSVSLLFGLSTGDDSSAELLFQSNTLYIQSYGDPGSSIQFGTRSSTASAIRMIVTQDGTLQINNNSNSGVVGTNFIAYAVDSDSYFRLGNNTSNSLDIQLTRSDTTTMFSVNGHTGNAFIFGSLGVGAATSGTAGRIDASNDIVAYSSSDLRLKENIKPIENALDKVKALTGVEFDWKAEHKEAHGYEGHDTGVIAQEVQEVMPTAVRTNDTGYLAVRYEKLIGLLIEAVKEQQAEIDELKKLIK